MTIALARRMGGLATALLTWWMAGAGAAAAGRNSAADSLRNDEFEPLAKQIRAFNPESAAYQRLLAETLRRDALLLPGDRTPVDVALRRTAALLSHIKTLPGAPDLSAMETSLAGLAAENREGLDEAQQRVLYGKVRALRRRIAFSNPLLDFKDIVFLKHAGQTAGSIHMVDQYLGFNASPAGGLFVLADAFSDNPSVRSLLAASPVLNGPLQGRTIQEKGAFISLELDYDARTLYFAYTQADRTVPTPEQRAQGDSLRRMKNTVVGGFTTYYWDEDSVYHIFKAGIDGGGLTQLTFGCSNDFDPCVLPNGRIAFISDRIGGNQRCGARFCSTYTLHGMMADGADVIPLSFHETNEWQPSVDNSGMLVYTRWDYVDRDSDIAHHIWHCFPDGRDPRSHHGNYPAVRESRPWMEMSIRAIPDSHKYIAAATPHHGQNYGSLVLIDLRKTDDHGMAQLKRVTPEVHLPEAEQAPGVPHAKGKHAPDGMVYGQPWPLSEDFYLATYFRGIYLVDSFGNKEKLYDGAQCIDPIPLKPRLRPRVIPAATAQAAADRKGGENLAMGTVMVMNVYESEQPWPRGSRIKALRIINVFPKPNGVLNIPDIGLADQSLARGVLGTVPVEEDGSAYFRCPAGCEVYFQALDEHGMMVQNMRSATYLHPCENLSCIGCHESKKVRAPKEDQPPLALRRPPSDINPECSGSYPLTFPRLVQPVLEKRCVACHSAETNAPSLAGEANGRSAAFKTLSRFAWGKNGGNGAILRNDRSHSIPGQEGARVSKLYKLLAGGHHGVQLTAEEMHRITLWIDCNSNFYGAYHDEERQARGEVVRPLLGVPLYSRFEDYAN